MSTPATRGRGLRVPATPTNIYLTDALSDWLHARAKRNQLSVSSEARALLMSIMQSEEKEAHHV